MRLGSYMKALYRLQESFFAKAREFEDKFWMDSRGTPHTEQMHTIERWTRTSYGAMTNDFTPSRPKLRAIERASATMPPLEAA